MHRIIEVSVKVLIAYLCIAFFPLGFFVLGYYLGKMSMLKKIDFKPEGIDEVESPIQEDYSIKIMEV